MTSWNPRNHVYTGDPSPRPTGDVELGVGHAGHGTSVSLPARNPIGFAPAVDPEPRFHTEISFKRHHAPLASSHLEGGSGDELESGSVDLGWHSPEGEAQADVPVASSFEDELVETVDEPESSDEPVVESEQADTKSKVPFYKRELSFRRRNTDLEPDEVAPEVVDEPLFEEAAVEEPMFEEPLVEEPVAVAPVSEGPGADESPVVEPVALEPVLDEPVADEPSLDEPLAEEPFVEEPFITEPLAEEPLAEEPSLDEPVAEESFADEPVVEEPVADEPVTDETPAVAEPIAAVTAAESGGRSMTRSFTRKRNGSTPGAKTSKRGRGGKAKTVVGLKIGTSQIAAAVISDNGGQHELVQLARRPIESGLVVDGEVRDADALAHQLKAFFDENNLPRKNVRIGLASNRIGVRTFDIAGIDDATRFDNAVRFKAHEVLPVAQHESVLDYRVLSERPAEDGETSRRILLVVAPRDQVEPYVDVARRAGIQLGGLDLEALSLLRTFVDPAPAAVEGVEAMATVIVSIGHESTTLLVSGGGACEFTRVFDWGGGALQDAVVQELEVPHAEAATILRHLSLSGPGRFYESLAEDDRRKATEAVRLRLSPVARELVSSLQFYQTQEDSLGIGEIVITGGTSHLEGLGDALHQMIGVSVRLGDPLARVTVAHELDAGIEAAIGSLAVPIGLAIEDERTRSVNLLPSDAQTTQSKRPSLVKVAVPVAVAVPVVALGLMFVSAHGKVGSSQAELDAVQAQIDALPKPRGPVIDVSLQGSQAQRAQVVANVLVNRVDWDAVLHDISRVLPANVWLNTLQAQASATGAPGAAAPIAVTVPGVPSSPTGVHIDGYTYSQTDVARLLARLATLPTLTNVTLTSSTVEAKGKKSVVHFQIAADLNTGGS